MNAETIQIAFVAILIGLLIWPDVMLQVVGVLMFVLAPFDAFFNLMSGAPMWGAMVAGLLLIGLGRVAYHLKIMNKLMRAANPDAVAAVPQKRLGF